MPRQDNIRIEWSVSYDTSLSKVNYITLMLDFSKDWEYMSAQKRTKAINDIVQAEFKKHVRPVWKIL